jgi:hypothetical protein
VKPKIASVTIHKEHMMTDYEIDKLYDSIMGPGPGSFTPEYKLTEKRIDIGVPKFIESIKERDEENEIDDRIPLYPNTKLIMPNHMTFKYYQPSKDLGPQHTPEKLKNPGNWKYYNVDLDVVRE